MNEPVSSSCCALAKLQMTCASVSKCVHVSDRDAHMLWPGSNSDDSSTQHPHARYVLSTLSHIVDTGGASRAPLFSLPHSVMVLRPCELQPVRFIVTKFTIVALEVVRHPHAQSVPFFFGMGAICTENRSRV